MSEAKTKRQILFVDDEEMVLAGLRRLLRPMRHEWDMHFALGGKKALEALESQSFDVMVTDVRMPDIDGSRLLRHVKAEHPRIIRIVLSGHAELEVALKTLCAAHQFLSKPCDPRRLKEVVDRAFRLDELLDDENIRQFVNQLSVLPAMPKVYRELMHALASPDTTVKETAAIIEQDMALCAKLLQLINSAFYPLPRQVTTIATAVSYLGTVALKNLVLSFEVHRWVDEVELPEGFYADRLQRASLRTSRVVGGMLDDASQKDSAFTAAMLLDIGQLVLATAMPEAYQEVLSEWHTTGKPLYALEERRFGVSHTHIGAYLVGIWGLPHAVVEAIAYHHRPSRIGSNRFDVAGAIHVADVLAAEWTQKNEPEDALPLSPLDTNYLRDVRVESQLTKWRKLTNEQLGRVRA